MVETRTINRQPTKLDYSAQTQFMSMKNEEGYSLTKTINKYKETGKHPDHYNTDGTWKYPNGRETYEQFRLEKE